MKRFNLVFLLCLTITILSTPIVIGTAQTISQPSFNGSFTVKVGDSNRYDVVTAIQNNKHYLPSYAPAPNGTLIPINITEGSYISVTVSAINTSSSGVKQVFVKQTLQLANHKTYVEGESQAGTIINLGFTNYTDAKAYYNATPQFIINLNSNETISRNGDIIKLSSSSTTNQTNTVNSGSGTVSSTVPLLTSETEVDYNWKTGWLEKLHMKSYLTNGTIITEILYQRHTDDIFRSITALSVSTLELASIGVLIAIPVLLAFSYKSYTQLTKSSSSSQSFPQYLQSKMKYSKKKPKKKSVYSADKALETIESILEETGTQSK